MPFWRRRRLRLRFLLIIPCEWPALPRRKRPPPVLVKRLAAARLVFILGMAFLVRAGRDAFPLPAAATRPSDGRLSRAEREGRASEQRDRRLSRPSLRSFRALPGRPGVARGGTVVKPAAPFNSRSMRKRPF